MAGKRGGIGLAALPLFAVARGLRRGWDAVIAGWGGSMGAYPSADIQRKILEGWRTKTLTANQALAADLTTLVAQGRQLDRASPVVRGAIEGRKAELVGTGIAVDPATGDSALDALLRAAFQEWSADCGVCGESLWTLQRMASGECDAAGAFLWRLVVIPDRVSQGLLPCAILPLEVEWLSEMAVEAVATGNEFVRGVEIDKWSRPVAYHLRNPDTVGFGKGERVLAAEIIDGHERRRARQALGEPRLAPLIERSYQDDQLVISELKAARNGSGVSAVVNDDELAAQAGEQTSIQPGSIAYLPRQATLESFQLNRPAQSVSDFRGTIRGDLAAGASISRVWLDRDGGAYNFANSRFDQIRTQMMVRPAQDWFGNAVASRVYLYVLPWLMLQAGRPWPAEIAAQRRLRRHRLVPDVPPELDEKSSVQAFRDGNAQRVTSRADYLGSRGKDPVEGAAAIASEHAADDQETIRRIQAAQDLCDAANAANPALNLHWSQVVRMEAVNPQPPEIQMVSHA